MAQSDLPAFRHLATDDDRAPSRPAFGRASFADDGYTGDDEPLVMNRDGADDPKRGLRPSPLLIGGGVALAAVVLLAAPLALRGHHRAATASGGGLRVTRTEPVNTPISARRSLPCFVGGVSVGDLPLMDCAARNGVASGNLDAGPDRPAAGPVVVAKAPQASVETPVRAPPPTRLAEAPPASLPRVFDPRPSRFAQASTPFDRRFEVPQRVATAAPPPAYARREPSRDDDLLEQPPSPAESAQTAQDFYRALGEADGVRAASLVVPEKRRGGPLSAPAIDRFYSNLEEPLRITDLRPLDNHTVSVRYQFVDPEGVLCSGASEVATTVRDGRVLVEGIRTHSRC